MSGFVVNFSQAAGLGRFMRALCWVTVRIMAWLVKRDTIRFVIQPPPGMSFVRIENLGEALESMDDEPTLAPGIGKGAPS